MKNPKKKIDTNIGIYTCDIGTLCILYHIYIGIQDTKTECLDSNTYNTKNNNL